jgi:ATP-dependent DNA helicase 2 subunit 2
MVCNHGISSLDTQNAELTSFKAISSIVLAIEMIAQHCKQLKYIRKIILVTDGKGAIDPDDIGQIVEKIKEEGIELSVL